MHIENYLSLVGTVSPMLMLIAFFIGSRKGLKECVPLYKE